MRDDAAMETPGPVARAHILRVRCPHCGAAPQRPCAGSLPATLADAPMPRVHAMRHRRAERLAERLGCEGCGRRTDAVGYLLSVGCPQQHVHLVCGACGSTLRGVRLTVCPRTAAGRALLVLAQQETRTVTEGRVSPPDRAPGFIDCAGGFTLRRP